MFPVYRGLYYTVMWGNHYVDVFSWLKWACFASLVIGITAQFHHHEAKVNIKATARGHFQLKLFQEQNIPIFNIHLTHELKLITTQLISMSQGGSLDHLTIHFWTKVQVEIDATAASNGAKDAHILVQGVWSPGAKLNQPKKRRIHTWKFNMEGPWKEFLPKSLQF